MEMHLSTRRLSALVLSAACLTALCGCTTILTAVTTGATPAGVDSNWQIESGSSIGAAGSSNIFLAGYLTIQGSTVTGAFTTNAPCVQAPQPLAYIGTYNSATGALSLPAYGVSQASPVTAQITVGANPSGLSPATLSSVGTICNVATANLPGVAMEIPPLNGTFAGTASGAGPGTATVSVTQSATPNSNAGFNLTGSLQFSAGACTATIPLAGSISGAGYSIASSSGASATIVGLDNVGGATLPSATITFPNGPCNTGTAATYTVNLVRQ